MNEITVQTVLETKYLKDNHVCIAGTNGLQRPVRWVHILEISDVVDDCIDGGELILTSGISFSDKAIAVKYLEGLIKGHAAGLAIETVLYYHEIGQELIDLANEHDFPLIEIPNLSRFIDISRGINSMISRQEEHRKKELTQKNYAWIEDWLNGRLTETQIADNLRRVGFSGHYTGFTVCGISLSKKKVPSSFFAATQEDFGSTSSMVLTMEIKKYFEAEGLTTLAHVSKDALFYIFMENDPSEFILGKITSAVLALRRIRNAFIDYENSKFAVGKKVLASADVNASMQTAVNLLDKGKFTENGLAIYDRLYIRRLFLDLADAAVLEEFVHDMLGTLIEPDNLILLTTLRVYYETNCSKQKTAEELYISRQTLYMRLNKIKLILGDDFELNEKRLAIECAIAAFFYQSST